MYHHSATHRPPATISSTLPPISYYHGQVEDLDVSLPEFTPYPSSPRQSAHKLCSQAPPAYPASAADHHDDLSTSSYSSIGDDCTGAQGASYASTPMKKRGSNNSLRLPSCSSSVLALPELTAAPPSTPTACSSGCSFAARVYRWEPYNSSVASLRCPMKEEELIQQLREAQYQEEVDEFASDLHWIQRQTQEEEEQHIAPPSTPVQVDAAFTVPPSSSTVPLPVDATDDENKEEPCQHKERHDESEFKTNFVKKTGLYHRSSSSTMKYFEFKEMPALARDYERTKNTVQRKQMTHPKKAFEQDLASFYYVKLQRQSNVLLSCQNLHQSLPVGFTSDEEALNYTTYGQYFTTSPATDVPLPGDIMTTTIPGFKYSAMKFIVVEAFRFHNSVPLCRINTDCTRYVENGEDLELDSNILDVAKELVSRVTRLEYSLSHKIGQTNFDRREVAFVRPVSLTLDLLELVDVELHTPAGKNKEITIFYREKADASKIFKKNRAAFQNSFLCKKESPHDAIDTKAICVHLNKMIKRSAECGNRFVAVRFVHIGAPVNKNAF